MRNETLEKSQLDTSTKSLMKNIIKDGASPFNRLVNGTLDQLCHERDIVLNLISYCDMSGTEAIHAKYISECYQRIIKLHQLFCREYEGVFNLPGLRVWGELCNVVRDVDCHDTSLVHLMVLNRAKNDQPVVVERRKVYDVIMSWCDQLGLDKEQRVYVDNNLKYKKGTYPDGQTKPQRGNKHESNNWSYF